MQKYKTIDLCAGIGGIRKGFERTKAFENVLSAERDEYAAKTYEHLYGEKPQKDLTDSDFVRLVSRTEYDVLLAGFPCQPFSSAGEKRGFADEDKGTIFFHIVEIIKAQRPKAIFLENVQNLVSHDKHKTIEKIIEVLEEELDYKIIGIKYDKNAPEGKKAEYNHASFVRNTKYFGLPQNRPRAYIMAFDRSLYGETAINMLRDTLPDPKPGEIACKPLDKIIEPSVDIHYYMSKKYLETLEKHKKKQKELGNGYGYCIVNSANRESKYANTIMATGGSGKERNLIVQKMPEYDLADERVQAIIKKKKEGLNKKNIRIMTPTEWGRLQGFIDYAFIDENGVDQFSFPEDMPESQKYKQFGNSVSIPVIESMARFMLECFSVLNRNRETVVLNYMKQKDFITREGVCKLLKISGPAASGLLKSMMEKRIIRRKGSGRGSRYYIRD